jgi:hypothetical protein
LLSIEGWILKILTTDDTSEQEQYTDFKKMLNHNFDSETGTDVAYFSILNRQVEKVKNLYK